MGKSGNAPPGVLSIGRERRAQGIETERNVGAVWLLTGSQRSRAWRAFVLCQPYLALKWSHERKVRGIVMIVMRANRCITQQNWRLRRLQRRFTTARFKASPASRPASFLIPKHIPEDKSGLYWTGSRCRRGSGTGITSPVSLAPRTRRSQGVESALFLCHISSPLLL